MRDPLETSELLAFTRTVDAKSLSRAALELGVPRATISRRLARLEERLGVRLLRRTTRALVLTEAGDDFYRQARLVLEAAERAEESVRRADDTVRGILRVTVPPIGDPTFHRMLCDFAAKFPEVRLHVSFTTRWVDLAREGYDVAIRAGSELGPGLIARTLRRQTLIAVAAPSYLVKHGTPTSIRDLAKHRCLGGFARGELPQSQWPTLSGGSVAIEAALASNDVLLLREAALSGLGIAMLPSLFVEGSIQAGKLVHVLEGKLGAAAAVSIVYPERQFIPPQVRAFVDAVVRWAPGRLDRPRDEPPLKTKTRVGKSQRRRTK
ncbi:MAG: LysR family transcriptional regulator [Polyangiaceae bacterium]